MKRKPTDPEILWKWIVRIVLLLIAGLLISILLIITGLDTDAQAPQRYMRLPVFAAGYTFTCVDSYPYRDLRPMAFDENTGFNIGRDFDLVEFVVAVDVYNVDIVYRYNPTDELFVWRMTCPVREGNVIAIHPSRGAAWVEGR